MPEGTRSGPGRFVRSLVSRLGRRLPGGLAGLARAVIHGWGMLTAGLRMEPDFIVVGAQRAGTTTMFRVLSEHPDVVRPTLSKGVGYFDLDYARGGRWYRGHFPIRAIAKLRTGGRAQAFESSGYYLFHPLAAERIARDLPEVKIVVLVRDPTERAYSAHRHEFARGFETEEFEAALQLEEARLAGEEDRLRTDPGYRSFEHRHHAYRGRSRYARQVQRYLDLLGPDRVFLVDADRFFVDPSVLSELFGWLGLSEWLPSTVAQWNAQARAPMEPALRAKLDAEFEADDRALAELLGRAPSWREHKE